MAKRNYTKLVTGKVTAIYCWLSKPDSGGRFSNDKYKLTLLIHKDDPEVDRIKEALDKTATAEWGKKRSEWPNIISPLKDGTEAADKAKKKAANNPDKFREKEHLRDHYYMLVESNNPPDLLIGGGKELPDGIEIFSGDLVKVSMAIGAWETTDDETGEDVGGLKAYLNQVLLCEKRSTASGGNDFGDDEDGYVPDNDIDNSKSRNDFGDDEDDAPEPANVNF